MKTFLNYFMLRFWQLFIVGILGYLLFTNGVVDIAKWYVGIFAEFGTIGYIASAVLIVLFFISLVYYTYKEVNENE